MKRMAACVLLVVLGLFVGACGGENDVALDPGDDDPTTTSSTTSSSTTTSSTTTSTTEPSTTTVPASSGAFVDPEGTYEIEVDPGWNAQHGSFAAGIEIWYLGPPTGAVASNVNVLTQAAPGVDLQAYLDLSVENADMFIEGAEFVDSGITQGVHDELGFMEYRGTQAGNRLHFLAYFAVQDGTAVVATLTSSVEEFDAARQEAESYLQTLRILPS